MALPEQQPEAPIDQQVVEIPDAPEIPAHVEQGGVQSTPSQAQPVQDDNGATIAQPVPVPAPQGKTVTIPATSTEELETLSKGSITDAKTWFGVYWIFKIRKALKDGIQVIFGKK